MVAPLVSTGSGHANLREIGSRAYVLVSGNNPIIAAQYVEFAMIGHASSAKAYEYRCWHRKSGRVVESYHVTFVEYLDDQPRALRPGVTVDGASLREGESATQGSTRERLLYFYRYSIALPVHL